MNFRLTWTNLMKFPPLSLSLNGMTCVALTALMSLTSLAADGKGAPDDLKAGFAVTNITPPAGAIITGPAGPISTGTDDPLQARAMVVQSGGRKLAIVGVDLVKVRRDVADQTIALVMQQTDITRDGVMICPSHNHSSPLIPAQGGKASANRAYIDTLPKLIAASIVKANEALQPARMSIGRSLVYEGHVNRRVISKADGLVLNNWLKKLNDLKQVPQVLERPRRRELRPWARPSWPPPSWPASRAGAPRAGRRGSGPRARPCGARGRLGRPRCSMSAS